jgi:glycosyltransferase involved in cell wall biosynthesis
MRILLLTQIIPYPPDAGPRVKTWHVLRYLAQRGHEVTLVSFVRPEEEKHLDALRPYCHAIHTVPIRRSRLADGVYWLRSHFSGRPFLIERDDLRPMRELTARLIAKNEFEAIHADQLTMTHFALAAKRNKNNSRSLIIFDAHNATWTVVARIIANAPWFLRPILSLEAKRIKAYEGMLLERFDRTMVVIEPDRDALLQTVDPIRAAQLKERIFTIPIAVDVAKLQPTQRQPDSTNILSLGSLNYPPNADGIRWFLREIFSKIQREVPNASLTVVGKDPPADFLEMVAQSSGAIKVTGYVPDLEPYMREAALMVVPVRAGGGMRVRLLEAFARAMPAVTTTIGLEGIEANHGEHVLVADDPNSFAEAAVRLLRDPDLQHRLGENGRRLAQEKYDWRVVLQKMDAVFTQPE